MTSNAAASGIDPREVLPTAGWTDCEGFAPVEGGWDNLIWRFESADGAGHALRLYRVSDETKALAIGAAWEEQALRTALALGLPAPAVEASGSYRGTPFAVQQWLPGKPLIEGIERTPWRIWSLGRAFERLQAQMHRLAPPELLRSDPLSWIGDQQAAEQLSLDGLRGAVREAATNDAFCHFDFHPLNVLAAGGRVTALLDFPNAALGDRRADLGRTQAILSASPLPPGPLKFVLQFARGRFIGAWKRGYEAEAGPTFPLDPLFEAWGAATVLGDSLDAVEEARGWAEQDDLRPVRAYLDGRRAAAGLSRDRPASG